MPQHVVADPALPGIFHALSDPTRLAVVQQLSIAPASASALARPFAMALPSFMQHMGVLERAHIVTSHKSGRTRTYQLAPGALRIASAWLAEFRNHLERKLDQLDHLLITTDHTATGHTATGNTATGLTPSTHRATTRARTRSNHEHLHPSPNP